MSKLKLFDRIRAYKMGEINWSECKQAVDEFEATLSKPEVVKSLPTTEGTIDVNISDALFVEYNMAYKNTQPGKAYPQWFTDEQLKWIKTALPKIGTPEFNTLCSKMFGGNQT